MENNPVKKETAVRPLDWTKKSKGFSYFVFFVILLVALLLGVGGGYVVSSYASPTITASSVKNGNQTASKGEGIADKKEFPDQAEGTLRAGGIDGEGNFHLERPGGESQNVYLTSSVVDLSKYVGKKVRVWGKTFQGEKAGWLMDVGFVENL